MKYILVSLMVVAMIAVGCKSSKVSRSQTETIILDEVKFEPSRLFATPWRLMKVETPEKTIAIPAEDEATIVFNEKDGRVNGRCCNSYFGAYSLNGNVVTFSNMGSTKMMCHGVMGEVETIYHSLLSVPQTITIDKNKMVMKSDKGTLYFDSFNLE